MSGRSYPELRQAMIKARDERNVDALRQLAVELARLETMEALALQDRALGFAAVLSLAFDDAYFYYSAGIAKYTQLGDNEGLASTLADLANAYCVAGDFPTALETFMRALAMLEELRDRNLLASTYSNIGLVLIRTGNYPLAMEYLQRGLMLHEELGDAHRAAHTTVTIGLMYYEMHDYRQASEYYLKALTRYEVLDVQLGIAITMNNIACCHLYLHEYEQAIELFRRCRELSVAINDAASIIRCDVNTAFTLVRSASFAEAKEILATLDNVVIDEPTTHVKREESRAAIQEAEGDSLLAIDTLSSLLAYVTDRSMSASRADIHRQLRDIAHRRSDFAGYVEHNNEYTRITEEINGKDTATKLAMQIKQREIDLREREHAQYKAVLHATLPKHIAERVVSGEVVNDHFTDAAVLFIDLVGFTAHTANMDTADVVTLLERIFTTIDAICDQHHVVKVKTIGDSYMCFRGDADATTNVHSIAMVATQVMHATSGIAFTWPSGERLLFRIGMHIGPVTAGVIGTKRLQYDVWGDTVNVTSRLESTGEPGKIQVSEAFAQALGAEVHGAAFLGLRPRNDTAGEDDSLQKEYDAPVIPSNSEAPGTWHVALRGDIELKGKGQMTTYWLLP